jgi:PilZ domain
MSQAVRAALAAEPVFDASEVRLMEAWRHEFMHVAMMSAFVTMGCNVLAENGSLGGLAALQSNLPEEPAIYRAIRQGLLEVPARYTSALSSAQTAYDQLGSALPIFRAALMQAPLGPRVGSGLPAEDLAAAWRSTCQAFLSALTVLDASGLLRTRSPTGTSLSHQCPLRLMQLLRAASAGETLASSGLVADADSQLPDWVQRRRWDRRNVNLKCTLAIRGGTIEAVIRNISMGGALLDGVPLLIRGSRAIVTTESGRTLEVSVMWSRERAAGVKFEQQLLYSDPLVVSDEMVEHGTHGRPNGVVCDLPRHIY